MSGSIHGMDASTARTANIRAWVTEAGGPAELSRAMGSQWSPSQISQWTSHTNPKGIGHKLARALEAALGKMPGEMDRPPVQDGSQPVGLDPAKLAASIEFLQDVFSARGVEFVAAEQSMLIAAIYAELLTTPKPNLIEMGFRYGRSLDDGRQRTAGSVGADDRAGNQQKPSKAKAAAGRKK